MDKQKEAEKLIAEIEQLGKEIDVMMKPDKGESTTPWTLEDKGAVITHVARFQILEEELSDLEDKVDDYKLGESYDDIVKIHKIVSEQCSIIRILLGF